MKGSMIDGLAKLKKQVMYFDPETYYTHIEVVQYDEPLQQGKWQYWDLQGNLIREEIYEKGILKEGD